MPARQHIMVELEQAEADLALLQSQLKELEAAEARPGERGAKSEAESESQQGAQETATHPPETLATQESEAGEPSPVPGPAEEPPQSAKDAPLSVAAAAQEPSSLGEAGEPTREQAVASLRSQIEEKEFEIEQLRAHQTDEALGDPPVEGQQSPQGRRRQTTSALDEMERAREALYVFFCCSRFFLRCPPVVIC
jgi:hypothetical protein